MGRGDDRGGHHQVYIGNISSSVTERDLKKLFKGFDVLEVSVKTNNYAFVTFGNYSDAREAVRLYHNSRFMNTRIMVEKARGTDWSKAGSSGRSSGSGGRSGRDRRSRSRSPRSPSPRAVYEMNISNLSSRTTKSELFNLANKYGDVTMCKINADDHKAVIHFRNQTSLNRALEKMHKMSLNDKEIRCESASLYSPERNNRARRERDRSSPRHSRSRSISRSRSPSRGGGNRGGGGGRKRSASSASSRKRSRSSSR